jgi:hypothetical protein
MSLRVCLPTPFEFLEMSFELLEVLWLRQNSQSAMWLSPMPHAAVAPITHRGVGHWPSDFLRVGRTSNTPHHHGCRALERLPRFEDGRGVGPIARPSREGRLRIPYYVGKSDDAQACCCNPSFIA